MPECAAFHGVGCEYSSESSAVGAVEVAVATVEFLLYLMGGEGFGGHDGVDHVVVAPVAVLYPAVAFCFSVHFCAREWC